MATRKVKRVTTSIPTLEGAGVHLSRAFGNNDVQLFDPFLLLDDFRSATPAHYKKGFPWHPHRGMETITYVLKGDVEHGDSLGNQGVITCGDVQWMTAGSGIIHQEMPEGDKNGKMEGFQLWVNLPAAEKMCEPRYRDIKAEQIPTLKLDTGVEVKVISGRVDEVAGPIRGGSVEAEYLDVWIPSHSTFIHPTPEEHTVFAYVYAGNGCFDLLSDKLHGNKTLILFEPGNQIHISAGAEGVNLLLVSGKPLREPIAWGGPIVMNTQAELQHAFAEFENGTFIKHG